MITSRHMEKVDDRNPYELGFLITPLIGSEELPVKVEEIIGANILALGGELLAPAIFKSISLAYAIKVLEGGKRETYTTAHFGSLGFKMESIKVPELHTALKLKKEIIRFLIISGHQALPILPLAEPTETPSAEAEIDKEIDELLATAV